MSTPPPLFQQVLQTPLFATLSEDEAAVLFGISDRRSITRGATLFEEGDPGDSLFILLEGEVDVLKKDPSGKQRKLARLSRGASIGEMSLLNDAVRSASVHAVTDLSLLRIPCGRFHRLLAEDNVPALKVVHNLAQVLVKRLAIMGDRVTELLDGNGLKRKEELASFQQLLSDWQF
ncbi:MAG TPA: cyclic nucleotide-binding domain-containing protein [Myxococcaceae bacterium]|nr:cyclic nucleotide-binding domain-containing protein [Myxococcaceae bacterium]